MNLLNTDPEIRNLFNYGIEGVHYTLDEQGQVVPNTDKDSHGDPLPDAPASRYSGVQYTQGNWFILKTMGGDNPDPLDKWDQFRKYNAGVVKSTVLGFTPDLSKLTAQTDNIEMVWHKYYPSLMTGSVDVDTILPKFNAELKRGRHRRRAAGSTEATGCLAGNEMSAGDFCFAERRENSH